MKIRNVDLKKDLSKLLLLDKERLQDILREKREPFLRAYDTYIANVSHGDISETPEQNREMIAWKKKALDLDNVEIALNAISNPPAIIRYYAGEKVTL